MSDSLSTNPVRGADAPDDADREARIEQLLLLGLDHYFAGHYEHAISVWTRVVFLERHHDRARAYIERARSALAERHRETEELLHTGVSAYNAGEVDKARELLTRAGDQGSDTAHIFLDRLNRVGTTPAAADLRIDPLPARPTAPRPRATMPPPRTGWTAAALFAIVVAVAMLVGGLPIGSWLSELEVTAPTPATQAPFDEPLPVGTRIGSGGGSRARSVRRRPSARRAPRARPCRYRRPVARGSGSPPRRHSTRPPCRGGDRDLGSGRARCAAVKCPKCHYLGFETGDRCKNCGYDFSLISEPEISVDPDLDLELALRASDDTLPATVPWDDNFEHMDADALADAAALAESPATMEIADPNPEPVPETPREAVTAI